MSPSAMRKSLGAGLSLATLLLPVIGCGGGAQSVDDAVLVSAPEAKTDAPAAPAVGAPAAPTSPAAAPTATPSAAVPSTAPAPSATAAAGFGTLKGKVVLGGAAPTPKILVTKGDATVKDPSVCAKEDIKSERLVLGKDNGVRYAIVYIPKPTAVSPEAKSAAETATVDFDQKGCTFVPHVVGVMTGSKINIKSSDPVGHNVNSKVQNNPLNSAIAGGSEVPFTTQAAARAPGQVVCDIHPWMTAYWMVTDSPYITVTDADGNFELKNVPAGSQKVVVWQEAKGFVTPSSGQDIVVAANGETSQEFKIDPGALKPEN
ncbi:carboxypeptidase regulatory-like domain-containing protein [Isosphaeraceae bacterium EP7]